MKQTRFEVFFDHGQKVNILTSGVYNAAVLAMANEIREGRGTFIEVITNLDTNQMYLQTEDMNFVLT